MTEPRRVSRRPLRLSHAAKARSYSMAWHGMAALLGLGRRDVADRLQQLPRVGASDKPGAVHKSCRGSSDPPGRTQRHSAILRSRLAASRQRSEQVDIVSQTRAHFLRQANGWPQDTQVLVGRSAFRRIFGICEVVSIVAHGQVRKLRVRPEFIEPLYLRGGDAVRRSRTSRVNPKTRSLSSGLVHSMYPAAPARISLIMSSPL